eukprot:37434-Pelagomonas_calceolata.AAC.1
MKRRATAHPPPPACPVTTAAPAISTLGRSYLTLKHQLHSSQTAGPTAPGQNTRGAVKKGQAASTDQDSQARAHKIVHCTGRRSKRQGTAALPGGMGLLGNIRPPCYGDGPTVF